MCLLVLLILEALIVALLVQEALIIVLLILLIQASLQEQVVDPLDLILEALTVVGVLIQDNFVRYNLIVFGGHNELCPPFLF